MAQRAQDTRTYLKIVDVLKGGSQIVDMLRLSDEQ